jgi:hypothetical protein
MKSLSERQNYKLGSHNTMSYLTPKNWFYRLFAFTARCQTKTIYDQVEKYGVRLVDLRFRFDKKGNVCFAHGIMEYKGDKKFILDVLSYLNLYKGFPVRVLCENKDKWAEEHFMKWCEFIEKQYPNIKFFGGRNKWTWKLVYDFGNDVDMEDKYSSNNTNDPNKPITGTYLDDWCPILYAKANNKKNRENGTEKEYLTIDFVEIW